MKNYKIEYKIEYVEIYVKRKWLEERDFSKLFLNRFDKSYRSGKVHVVKFLRDMHSGKFPVDDDIIMDFMEAWLQGPPLWRWREMNENLPNISAKALKMVAKEIDFEALKQFYCVTNLKDI